MFHYSKQVPALLQQPYFDGRKEQPRYHHHFHQKRCESTAYECSSGSDAAAMADEYSHQKVRNNRVTFHSDPSPHLRDPGESLNGLTRSLDTGGWR